MEVLVERCAGLDVGKADLKACVRVPGPRGGRRQQVKTFATTTGSLLRLRDWLVGQQVTVVGMEATGVYWKPVYYMLEDTVEVQLLNAAHMHKEYTAGTTRAACARLGITQSMGRPGSALDNAVIESWHSTLEFELRSQESFTTKAAAKARAAAWIEDCNHHRRHSALDMKSPVNYEQAMKTRKVA
ncbi:MAG TPA: integrase core domain-containing protein [Streptosporangiaceae bacterium]|nr:integrase core domain-containing protein [Streptosporangiaceae bacterium]